MSSSEHQAKVPVRPPALPSENRSLNAEAASVQDPGLPPDLREPHTARVDSGSAHPHLGRSSAFRDSDPAAPSQPSSKQSQARATAHFAGLREATARPAGFTASRPQAQVTATNSHFFFLFGQGRRVAVNSLLIVASQGESRMITGTRRCP